MWWILVIILLFIIGFLVEPSKDVGSSTLIGLLFVSLGGMFWVLVSLIIISSHGAVTTKTVENIKIEDNIQIVKVISKDEFADGVNNGKKTYIINETKYGPEYKIKRIQYKGAGLLFPITDTVVEVTIPPK